jgi:Ca2+-binding EF-hand superfamily protein
MQQEKTMRKSTRLALGFAALAGAIATTAYAAEGTKGSAMQGMHANMHKADADKSGGITFDEFSAAMKGRFEAADTNHDGKVTVEELAAQLEKEHYERMAKRMIARFDTKGDGVLTLDEVEGRQKKLFALLDKNDDGKLEKREMRGMGAWHHRGGWRGHHGGGQGGGQGHDGSNGGDVE